MTFQEGIMLGQALTGGLVDKLMAKQKYQQDLERQKQLKQLEIDANLAEEQRKQALQQEQINLAGQDILALDTGEQTDYIPKTQAGLTYATTLREKGREKKEKEAQATLLAPIYEKLQAGTPLTTQEWQIANQAGMGKDIFSAMTAKEQKQAELEYRKEQKKEDLEYKRDRDRREEQLRRELKSMGGSGGGDRGPRSVVDRYNTETREMETYVRNPKTNKLELLGGTPMPTTTNKGAPPDPVYSPQLIIRQ